MKSNMMVLVVGVLLSTLSVADVTPNANSTTSPIRVQLKAQHKMVLSSQLSGRIKHLPWKEGDTFKKGQSLVDFDCEIYQAKLDYAIAAEKTADKQQEVAKRLDRLQSISVMEVSKAQSDLIMAKAERNITEVMVKRCSIRAPFAGRVSKRSVEQGEFVSEGDPLLEIYDSRVYVVELLVPSRWIQHIHVGETFRVRLDETEKTYQASVTRLGAVIDPLSQSLSVFGKITSQDQDLLLPGMSGSALFDQSAFRQTKVVSQ